MAKKDSTNEEGLSSGLFAARDQLMGNASGVEPAEVDAELLWYVVCTLAARKASIQIGVTKDGSSWSVQYWDGKVPVKEYFTSTAAMNRSWAALLRAAYKRDVSPELNKLIEAYGW